MSTNQIAPRQCDQQKKKCFFFALYTLVLSKRQMWHLFHWYVTSWQIFYAWYIAIDIGAEFKFVLFTVIKLYYTVHIGQSRYQPLKFGLTSVTKQVQKGGGALKNSASSTRISQINAPFMPRHTSGVWRPVTVSVYIWYISMCVCLLKGLRWVNNWLFFPIKLWPSFLKLSKNLKSCLSHTNQSSLSLPQKTHTQKRHSTPEHSSIFLTMSRKH